MKKKTSDQSYNVCFWCFEETERCEIFVFTCVWGIAVVSGGTSGLTSKMPNPKLFPTVRSLLCKDIFCPSACDCVC